LNILRTLFLAPVSWLYWAVVGVRNICYDVRLARTEYVAVPVISVGNITAGGTGKTPFVEYLMTFFLQTHKQIALVSRGYKRSSRGTVVVSDGKTRAAGVGVAGDEPFQIARKFPRAAVIVDERKARGARLAVEQFHPDVILLDDGFQHRSLGRTLDIVMLDGRFPLKETALLPLGRRREQLSSLRRADAVVISGISGAPGNDIREYSDAPQFSIRYKPVSFCNMVTNEQNAPEGFAGKTAVAFCGVGNPESFRQTLDEVGLKVAAWMTFPDHYRYTESDVAKLRSQCENLNADFIVTTEKDAVRLLPLSSMQSGNTPLFYYVEIEVVVADGEQELHALIRSALDGNAGRTGDML